MAFKAPCDCTAVNGLKAYFPNAQGIATNQTFVFTDAHGNNLAGIGHLFKKGAIVKALLDVDAGKAYIQNADTNAYLEDRLNNHKHDAADIESGTLPLARGGLGRDLSTTPDYAILRNSGAGYDYAHYTATDNGALYATAENGIPKFGTLPVAQGGTGQTTASAALGALIVNSSALTATELASGDQIGVRDISASGDKGRRTTLANLATFLGTSGGMLRFGTGSYVGTVEYSDSTSAKGSQTVEFPTEAKAILLYPASDSSVFDPQWIVPGCNNIPGAGSLGSSGLNLTIDWDGSSATFEGVKRYASRGPFYKGTTYNYIYIY